MTKSILRKYAKLIVQMGVNIKKGAGRCNLGRYGAV